MNVGCVPKKPWYGAQFEVSLCARLWFRCYSEQIRLADLVNSRQAYIERIHGSYDRVLGNNNVTVLNGYGKLIDSNTVELTANNTLLIIFLATGGKPWRPDPGREPVLIPTVSLNSITCQKVPPLSARLYRSGTSW